MASDYSYVKLWRSRNKKNRAYNAKFMKRQRHYYKKEWQEGLIKYEDIPKAYRGFKNHELIVNDL